MSKRSKAARAAYLARERPGELVQVVAKPKRVIRRRAVSWAPPPMAPEAPVRAPDAPERSPGGVGIHCPFRHDGEPWYFSTWQARAQHLRTEHGWT